MDNLKGGSETAPAESSSQYPARREFMRLLSSAPLIASGLVAADQAPIAAAQRETTFEALAVQMNARGWTVDRQAPTRENLARLFDPNQREGREPVIAALDPRHCEEHLAVALASLRAATQERASFYQAGERCAGLMLSLMADQHSVALLTQESDALRQKREVTRAGLNSESSVAKAATNYRALFDEYLQQLDPKKEQARGDAERQGTLTYLARGVVSQAAKLTPELAQVQGQGTVTFGGVTATVALGERIDAPYGPQDTTAPEVRKIDLVKTPVATSESLLAIRSALAGFRLTHTRAKADLSSIDITRVSSEARSAVLAATDTYDQSVMKLAELRKSSVEEIVKTKQELASNPALLGFQQQMMLARARAWDLVEEATQRASAAREGITSVYNFPVPAPPSVSRLEDIEPFLFWCRTAARRFLFVQDALAGDTIRLSMRKAFGTNWKARVGAGASLSLSDAGSLRPVLRLRDVFVTAIGNGVPSRPSAVTPPSEFSDGDFGGQPRAASKQAVFAVRINPQSERLNERQQSCARRVHNMGVCGDWTVQHDQADLAGVEDLILELRVSFLNSPLVFS
jgi:hypothetical protein